MQIKEADLRASLCGTLSGVYLIAGEEEYLKHHYLSQIRSSVLGDESLAGFNHTQVNYLDGGFGSLSEAVTMTPFMAERRLCELSGFNFNQAKDSLLKQLRGIVDSTLENEECVLVLYADADLYDTQKGSKTHKKVTAALGEDVRVLVLDKTTPQKLAAWISRHFVHEKLEISESDCLFMVQRCGRSMQLLAHEIDKVAAYKHQKGESRVSRDDIIYLCPKNEEIGAFALANALLEANTKELFRILAENKKSGYELKPKSILASICSVYITLSQVKELCEAGADEAAIAKKLKIHEYKAKLYAKTAKTIPAQRLETAVALCVEADSDMKLLYSDEIVLERLLCSISQLR